MLERRAFVPLLFSLLLLLLITACGNLENAGAAPPAENIDAPTGSFGVSETFDGPFLSNADSAIVDASDERVLSVAPGSTFYVQANYADPDGIATIAVNLVNPRPEGLAGALDPGQGFFTLGQPTGISEPTSACDPSDSPTAVTCVYEIRVADDAVNISELEGAANEFAYVFRAQVTDAVGNTDDGAEQGYVVVADGEGDNGNGGDDGAGGQEGETPTCTNPVSIPDAALERELRGTLQKPAGELTCEDLASLTRISFAYDPDTGSRIESLEGLQYARNLTDVRIVQHAVSDIAPLQSIPGLERLELFDNALQDVTQHGPFNALTGLFVGGNQIGDLSSFAETFPNLEELNVQGNPITDYTPLQNLTGLTLLDINGENVSDLAPLQNLSKLTSLGVSDSNVADLSPLSELGDLESLVLVNNQISDLAPLGGLTQLVFLNLDGNSISDLAPLQGLGNLENLNLSRNNVSNLAPIQGLSALEFLDLSRNNVSNLAPLADLTNLFNLFLNNNQIDDVAPLLQNEGLAEDLFLKLEFNLLDTCPGTDDRQAIETLEAQTRALTFDPPVNCQGGDDTSCTSPVEVVIPDDVLETAIREALGQPDAPLTCEDLAQLTSLSTPEDDGEEVNFVGVSTLEGLQFAVNLQNLSVAGPFNTTAPIQNLTKLNRVYLRSSAAVLELAEFSSAETLTELTLPGASPTSLQPLSNLTNLEELRTTSPEDNDYSPLQNLTDLERLYLSANGVSDLAPLQNLSKLTVLDLYANNVSDLTPLQGLTNLAELDLGRNTISNVAPLQGLTQLQELSLAENRISDLTPLQNLTELTELLLNLNDIVDIDALVNNQGLSEGDFVDLFLNRLETCPGEEDRADIDALLGRGVEVRFGTSGCEN